MSTGEKTHTADRGFTPAMRWMMIIALVILVVGLGASIALVANTPPDGGTVPGAAATSAPPQRGPSPGAAPTTGSEVQSPAPRQTHTAALPPLPAKKPRVSTPLPVPAKAQGELVAGFPTAEMAPTDGSEIISSSIATEGARMQVTLVARSDADQSAIIEHYRQSWSAQGLTDAARSDDAHQLTFTDSFTNLTLAFSSTSGTGTVYTLYGVYRAN